MMMSLPPGVENINYRQYRLELRYQSPGWKILIYPPGAEFGLSEVPNTKKNDERETVIAQAKKVVGADIEKKRDTPTGSYVPK
jgi:hypothetical protein